MLKNKITRNKAESLKIMCGSNLECEMIVECLQRGPDTRRIPVKTESKRLSEYYRIISWKWLWKFPRESQSKFSVKMARNQRWNGSIWALKESNYYVKPSLESLHSCQEEFSVKIEVEEALFERRSERNKTKFPVKAWKWLNFSWKLSWKFSP